MFEVSAETWHGISVVGNILLTLLLLNAGVGYLTHRVKDRAAWERHIELYSFMKSFLSQEMVYDRLRQLAATYGKAARHQAQVLANPQDDGAIRDAADRVSESKEAFWKAQNGARVNGYKVEQSFKAYLPTGPRSVA